MRLLVLGKNGQVGWELVRALSPLGEVIALGRAEADFGDPAQLREAVVQAAPNVIVNASAYTAVDKAESEPEHADRINHRAVGELGEIAAQLDSWLIHYSSDYVFDGRKPVPYTETDETAPQNSYGRSKCDGETALVESGAEHLIFRTSWVHSARGKNFIRTILRLAAERQQLQVVADQVGAPTAAELIADVTAHAVAAISRDAAPISGIYHLTAAGETSWHGLAKFVIAEALELGAQLKSTPDTIAAISTEYSTAAIRPSNSRLSTSKLRGALGLTLPDWRLHVRRTVTEFVEGDAA